MVATLRVSQIGICIAYETSVSMDSNIRADLALIFPAIIVTGWFAYRTPGPG